MKYALAKVSGEHNHKKISLEDVEVPQYESREEFETAAGSAEVALAFINKAIANVASQRARNAINSAEDTVEETKVIADARKLAKDTVPTDRTRSGASVKDRADAGKELAERVLRGEALSPEDAARFAKMFGVTM